MTLGTLGPEGSFSSIAARKHFGSNQDLQFFSSIPLLLAAVYQGKVESALVPIENQLAGPVTETLDFLADHCDQLELVDSFVFSVTHAVGALDPKNVKAVKSHPQALCQCSDWLDKNLSNAAREAASSTSSAIEEAKSNSEIAVIGPEETIKNAGLTVLETNASNQDNNKTRFTLVTNKKNIKASKAPGRSSTLFVVDPKRDRQGILFELLELISKDFDRNLLSIQSRPDAHGCFLFHFAVEGHKDDPEVKDCFKAIEDYISKTGQDAQLKILGSIPLTPFYRSDLQNITIVGGSGEMGRWLKELFQKAGLSVTVIERQDKKLKHKVEEADAILLSVPMSSVTDVLESIKPHVTNGKLVVENCSVKSASLPQMKRLFGSGVEVLGMHTMFGPSVDNLSGENVVFTRTESSGELAAQFENIFYKFGAVTNYLAEETHDEVTAYTQALAHFVLLGYEDALNRSKLNSDLVRALSTPNSRELSKGVKRINPEISENLQTKNTEAAKVRKKFIKSLQELDKAIEDGKGLEKIKQILSS